MVFRAVRLILGAALAALALVLSAYALHGMATSGPRPPREWILPVGMLVGSAAVLLAYYAAFFRAPTAFKGFRAMLGAAVGIVGYWLVATGAVGVYETITAETFKAGNLTAPIVGFILAAGIALVFYFSVVVQTSVRRVLENMFSIPELLKKLAFTLALLCIYRIGYHIPLPGLNQEELQSMMSRQQEGPFGQALAYFALFTGGNLQQSTLFGLGIMPYISASIIFTLLTTVVPALEKLKKEGQAGYKKIQEYTRYATVLLCLIQASMWMQFMRGQALLYTPYLGSLKVYLMGVLGLTAGTIFMMWLGEQIDEYGIGNGISLIIMAGIVARLPWAIRDLITMSSLQVTGSDAAQIGLVKIIFLVAAFVFVVAGSILICQAQRRIPIQQAKQTRGRRVYGGQRQYLPLRVNHGGVMPIIFASSLLLFPNVIFRWLAEHWRNGFTRLLAKGFTYGDVVHELAYVGLIFFFAYFWTTVQFRPKDMSEQLQDYGSFIPGLRPGKRTADYLERVMERITYCGAAFLAALAVIPEAVAANLNIPSNISQFLGGTGLLIVVSVALDLVQRIEANLIMRNYGGFLGDSGRIKGAYGR